MYLRRKCYSSLYDDLYNDYLYEKCYSDAYDYYTRLFSDDEDYGKQGALIGAGIGAAGGLTAAGYGINKLSLLKNAKDKIKKGNFKDISEKESDALFNFIRKINAGDVEKEGKRIWNNKDKILEKLMPTINKYNNINLNSINEDFLKQVGKDISEPLKSEGKTSVKNIAKRVIARDALLGTGLTGAGIAALGGIGYGLGKLKKRNKNKD
jgi:hypothetical protein